MYICTHSYAHTHLWSSSWDVFAFRARHIKASITAKRSNTRPTQPRAAFNWRRTNFKPSLLLLFFPLLPFKLPTVAKALVEKVPRVASSTIKAKESVRAGDLHNAAHRYLMQDKRKMLEYDARSVERNILVQVFDAARNHARRVSRRILINATYVLFANSPAAASKHRHPSFSTAATRMKRSMSHDESAHARNRKTASEAVRHARQPTHHLCVTSRNERETFTTTVVEHHALEYSLK